MMRRFLGGFTYANVMVTVLALVVLTGGGAMALAGQATPAVTAGAWHVIGAQGQPRFRTSNSCRWSNYDGVHSNAAFLRDSAGFVHVKGMVVASDSSGPRSCTDSILNATIFVLPAGYRPARRESMAGLTGRGIDLPQVVAVSFDGPSVASLPAGAVSADLAKLGDDPYVTLDGAMFRCAPSGHNGCP
jgi:hypothetical protein